MLGILLAVLIVKLTDRLDQIDEHIKQLENNITAPEVATVTDATPDEPEEINVSLRPEFLTSENAQEASGMILEDIDEQIDLDELKSVPEASEVVCEAVIIEPYEEVEIIPFKDTYTYLGSYELTAYAWTGNPCANGNYPSCGYTVASNSIPMGSRIYIEGYGEYVVEDRGGMPSNVIDVYMGDYDTCIQFGRQTADVYLIN